jgi:hypothetical protein
MTHDRQPVSLLAVRARRGAAGLRASDSEHAEKFHPWNFSARRSAVHARAGLPLASAISPLLALRLP